MHNLIHQYQINAQKLFMVIFLSICMSSANASERDGLVLQVSDADPKIWDLALNIAEAAPKRYGKALDVRIVAFGPGLKMLTMDSSVANRLEAAAGKGVSFLACGTTMDKLKMKDENLYPSTQVKRVDGGVIEIMRLQKAGWHYIKP